MTTTNTVLLVAMIVVLALYLLKRRSRMNKED